VDPELREKRRAAGARGGRATAAKRAGGVPHGTDRMTAAVAPPPDDGGLVFGTAKELREMAAAMTGDARATFGRHLTMSNSRVTAFRARHPDAELPTLVGRPLCETEAPPAARGLRVQAAANGPAELWIDDAIMWPNSWGEGISARDVRAALDETDGRDVVVHMNSPGGDVFEGIAIYQAFKAYTGDVYIAVDALAASIASVISMAGDTVGIGDMAFMMIHEARGFAYGTVEDMNAMADLLDQVSGTIAGAYARKVSGQTVDYWRDLMVAETWMDSDRALEEGLADERMYPDEEPEETAADVEDSWGLLFTAGVLDDRPAATVAASPAPAPTPPPPDPTPDWGDLFNMNLEDMLS
jgi:ATP-dependent protease ClpP protease subunit